MVTIIWFSLLAQLRKITAMLSAADTFFRTVLRYFTAYAAVTTRMVTTTNGTTSDGVDVPMVAAVMIATHTVRHRSL